MNKKFYILFVLFCISNFLLAQVNLVPNPSFEIFNSCPTGMGQIGKAVPWFSPIYPSATSDYFNSCDISNYVGVPNNQFGFQEARTGKAYPGIGVYTSNSYNAREYIESKLILPLIANKTYCMQFFVSKADNVQFAVDGMGAYFSNDSVLSTFHNVLPFTPQINNPTGNIIADTVNWIKISGSFTASGGEKFITIGNFKTDVNTNWQYISGPLPGFAYYLIDDVSVYACDAPVYVADAGSSMSICKGDSVLIGTHNLPEYIYKWYDEQNHLMGSTGQIYVKPTQTAIYTLKVKDFKFDETTAQVTVTVKDCHDIFVPNAFTPGGDGVNDVFKVHGQNIKTLHSTIINRWGQELYKWSATGGDVNTGWDGKYKGTYVSAGVYFYIIDVAYENGETIRKTGSVEVVR